MSGFEVTLAITQQDEPALLQGLQDLGHVTVPPGGSRDQDGHLLVMLKHGETFTP